MKSQKIELISGSTIIDLRKFDTKDFNGIVGDIHSTIPIYQELQDTKEDFFNRFNIIYNIFKQGININNILYYKYPAITNNLKKFENCLDDNLKFSANYLGGIKEDQYQQTIQSLLKSKQKLNNFSVTKLYISFFKHKDKLIFIPLTDNVLNIDILNEI